jgi:hypothetical protein
MNVGQTTILAETDERSPQQYCSATFTDDYRICGDRHTFIYQHIGQTEYILCILPLYPSLFQADENRLEGAFHN